MGWSDPTNNTPLAETLLNFTSLWSTMELTDCYEYHLQKHLLDKFFEKQQAEAMKALSEAAQG